MVQPGQNQSGSLIERIARFTRDSWDDARVVAPEIAHDCKIFSELLNLGYTPLVQDLFNADAFDRLLNQMQDGSLRGKSFAVCGAGAFGLTIAMALSETEADVTVYSAGVPKAYRESPSVDDGRHFQAITALKKAIGILEPQGRSLTKFTNPSFKYYDLLTKQNQHFFDSGQNQALIAPVRKAPIVYLYKDTPDQSFVEELHSMPQSNYIVEPFSEFGCKTKLTFDGYIASGSGLSDFYLSVLKSRGVNFVERDIKVLGPQKGHDFTFTALGLGRSEITQTADKADVSVDLPGNRGQMLAVEGSMLQELIDRNPHFANVGSFGVPTPSGSVNIVIQYENPITREKPSLIIGATKKPGSNLTTPVRTDHEFLMAGVSKIWPALFEALEASTASDRETAALNYSSYVCVRPGGGETSFNIKKYREVVDIHCAGGTGITTAPAAALKAISMALE